MYLCQGPLSLKDALRNEEVRRGGAHSRTSAISVPCVKVTGPHFCIYTAAFFMPSRHEDSIIHSSL